MLREMDQAVRCRAVIVPVRIDETPISKEMAYYVGAEAWQDAPVESMAEHVERLATTIRRQWNSKAAPRTRRRASQGNPFAGNGAAGCFSHS